MSSSSIPDAFSPEQLQRMLAEAQPEPEVTTDPDCQSEEYICEIAQEAIHYSRNYEQRTKSKHQIVSKGFDMPMRLVQLISHIHINCQKQVLRLLCVHGSQETQLGNWNELCLFTNSPT